MYDTTIPMQNQNREQSQNGMNMRNMSDMNGMYTQDMNMQTGTKRNKITERMVVPKKATTIHLNIIRIFLRIYIPIILLLSYFIAFRFQQPESFPG